VKEAFHLALPPDTRPGDPAFVAAYRRIEALIEPGAAGRP
jgi:hypothetical protein